MGQQPRARNSSRDTVAARLVAVGGSTSREHRLRAGKTSIGYARDNDIVLDASTVSRYHAVIRRRIGGYALSDLESTNGTFVNGNRIKNPITLKGGDEVRFGDARFAFRARSRSIVREFRSIRPFPLALITVLLFVIGFGVVRYRVRKAARLRVTNAAAGRMPAASSSVGAQAAASAATSGSPTDASAAAPAEPEWLALLNWYRKLCGLKPVSEDSKL